MRYVLLGLTIFSSAAIGAVPFTFQLGQAAKASEVNANFQNLDQRIANALGDVDVTTVSGSTTFSNSIGSTASATCPSGTIATVASCTCDNNSGNNNFGWLSACFVTTNGAVAGCSDPSYFYSASKPGPITNLSVQCISVQTTNGGNVSKAYAKQNADVHSTELQKLEASLSAMEAARKNK